MLLNMKHSGVQTVFTECPCLIIMLLLVLFVVVDGCLPGDKDLAFPSLHFTGNDLKGFLALF